MKIENLSTLQIHKLTQVQYERELDAGRIDEYALYLVPDDEKDLSNYYTKLETDNRIEELSSNKQNKLIFDQTPTANSANPVTSGGVYSALKNIVVGGGGVQMQADYNQNDASELDYIKNRPFYDNRLISNYSYAENPNPISFNHEVLGYTFYKVSDLTLDQLFSKSNLQINVASANGEIREATPSQNAIIISTDDMIVTNDGNWGFLFTNKTGTLGFTYSGYPMSVDVPEVGVYVIMPLNQGLWQKFTCEIDASNENDFKQIDPKFIPANLDFNLSDYYTKSEIDSVLGNVEAILDEISVLIGE